MAKTKFDNANVEVTQVQLDGSGNIEVTLDTTIIEKVTYNVSDVTLLINGNNNVVTTLKFPSNNKITLVPSLLNAGINENLTTNANVNIVNDNGTDKYVFNNLPTYVTGKTFHLPTGTYTVNNVPIAHPMAILNNGISNITYEPDNTTAIIIKVSGGSFSSTNSDYYTFTDVNNAALQIGDGSFLFMRGKKYRFQGNNVSSDHPFRLFSNGGFSAAIINNEIIDVVIPLNQSVTSGDIYYQCQNHSAMKANLALMYKSITGSTNDAGYDFYYGNIQINVIGDFGNVSVYGYHHGYMGGENLLVYGNAGEQLQESDMSNVYFSYTKHTDITRNWENANNEQLTSFHYSENVPKLLNKTYIENNITGLQYPFQNTENRIQTTSSTNLRAFYGDRMLEWTYNTANKSVLFYKWESGSWVYIMTILPKNAYRKISYCALNNKYAIMMTWWDTDQLLFVRSIENDVIGDFIQIALNSNTNNILGSLTTEGFYYIAQNSTFVYYANFETSAHAYVTYSSNSDDHHTIGGDENTLMVGLAGNPASVGIYEKVNNALTLIQTLQISEIDTVYGWKDDYSKIYVNGDVAIIGTQRWRQDKSSSSVAFQGAAFIIEKLNGVWVNTAHLIDHTKSVTSSYTWGKAFVYVEQNIAIVGGDAANTSPYIFLKASDGSWGLDNNPHYVGTRKANYIYDVTKTVLSTTQAYNRMFSFSANKDNVYFHFGLSEKLFVPKSVLSTIVQLNLIFTENINSKTLNNSNFTLKDTSGNINEVTSTSVVDQSVSLVLTNSIKGIFFSFKIGQAFL